MKPKSRSKAKPSLKAEKIVVDGVEVLTCPCCGNSNLDVGVQACSRYGVRCWGWGGGCGLELSVDMFNIKFKSPKGCRSFEPREKAALKEAVLRWNGRWPAKTAMCRNPPIRTKSSMRMAAILRY